MSDSEGDKFNQLSFAHRNGVSVNKEGGYYCHGKQYSVQYGKEACHCGNLPTLLAALRGRPSLLRIAHEHKVDRKFVRKIESKLIKNNGRVVSPEEVILDMVSRRTLGPGTNAFDQVDSFDLYCLIRSRPT